MRFVYTDLIGPFDIGEDYISTLVVENQRVFTDLLTDIHEQISGSDGAVVLSENYVPLDIGKYTEVIADYLCLDINRKNLISKLTARIEETATDSENYPEAYRIVSELEQFADKLTQQFPFTIEYDKLSIQNIIKSLGLTVIDDYSTIAEKLVAYMTMVREIEKSDKLFILVNLRSYVGDDELALFFNTCIMQKFRILLIDSSSYDKINYEHRITVDKDMCVF